MTQQSFSANSVDILRTKLSGILESYANPWDLLAEMAQNSIDSIRQLGVVRTFMSKNVKMTSF